MRIQVLLVAIILTTMLQKSLALSLRKLRKRLPERIFSVKGAIKGILEEHSSAPVDNNNTGAKKSNDGAGSAKAAVSRGMDKTKKGLRH